MLKDISLKENKIEFSKQLIDQLVTSVIVLDHQLKVKFLNSAAEALFSKSINRVYNLPILDIFINSTISEDRLKQVLINSQEITNSEVSLHFIDNVKITIELSASIIFFNEQKHLLLECRQIDKQKKISSEVFQEQQWVAARDLIRGLAHEIKNPLGGLRGAAQLLDKELVDEQREFTSMIIEQADRLTNLVDRLLGPNQLPKMELHNIHEVIEKVHQLVCLDNHKNINFIRDYDPSIPDMEFDTEQLQQTLLNIIGNAIHVLDVNGQIILKTRIANNQTINGKSMSLAIKISVIDNGPGIPDEIQDTIFYPMVSGRENGTGLGLSIAQTLIHQHNGKLTCESQPGKTTFNILLPLPRSKKQ